MNDLLVVETLKPLDVFKPNGATDILDRIRKEALSFVPDISTKKGREQIASLARKIASSKVFLDDMGKELVEDEKQKIKMVDAERKRIRDDLDALKEQVRAPLTEWEKREDDRVARHEATLAKIEADGRDIAANWQAMPAAAMAEVLKGIQALGVEDWQEFAARAAKAIEQAEAAIQQALEKREKYDAEQAELARLRREEEGRKTREREQQIAAEAAAKAKADAEKAAREEIEAAEREKEEAKRRARKAEEERDAAAKAERDRIEQERKDAEQAAAKREADKKHRAKINNEALNGIVSACSSPELAMNQEIAKAVVEAIAKGLVPHVKISY